jgi:homocysteine S-methyltransferase
MARVRMGPLAIARRVREETSLEVILHKTTRDRNILGLQADCLAASALGVENILALTGDPPSAGDYPFSVAVWEATSKELIEMIKSLNSGMDLLGNPLQSPTRLWVGSASGVEPKEEVYKRLKAKIEAGAGFVMTQPVFDLDNFKKFVSEVKKFDIPIFAGVMPLFSREQAEYLHNEVPGIIIPEDIRKRADKDGVKIAKEIVSGLKEIVNGVCVMLSKSKYSIIKELIKSS